MTSEHFDGALRGASRIMGRRVYRGKDAEDIASYCWEKTKKESRTLGYWQGIRRASQYVQRSAKHIMPTITTDIPDPRYRRELVELDEAIKSLPPVDKWFIVQYLASGSSLAETSRTTGLAVSTCWQRLNRAMSTLKEMMT